MLFVSSAAALACANGETAAFGNAAPQDFVQGQHPEIVVTAPSLFRDVRPERNLDETAIESYGVSTIDELVAEIQADSSDEEEPIFIVNGERVYDLDDIGAYPVEALRQVQVLPRGSGVRVGGSPGKRVISMTLHRQMRSATLTVAPKVASEGDWGSARGETLLTYMRGQTRANVAFRTRDEDALLESERDIIQPLSPILGEFRTLRPAMRSYDLNASYRTRLAPWLSSNATLRFGRSTSRSLLGLPFGILPTAPDLSSSGLEALRSRHARDSAEGTLTVNATLGRWSANFNARHRVGRTDSEVERQDRSTSLADTADPFSNGSRELIAIRTDEAVSRTRNSAMQLSFTGPALALPAGPLQATAEGRLGWHHLKSHSSFAGATPNVRRSEQSIRAALDIPLASRRNGFLPGLGELSATAEYSRVRFSDAGTLQHHSMALIWEPIEALRLRAAFDRTRTPASIERLGDPIVITPDIRIFDPLTGATVDVVEIAGGNPFLLPERADSTRVSGLLRLIPRLGLQANAEYAESDKRNFVSSLPIASVPIMLAFPDRFVRDDAGVLTLIDLRPVNFAGHREQRFRYGLSLNAPLGSAGTSRPQITAAGEPADAGDQTDEPPIPSGPRTRLMLTANHTLLLSDKIDIRPGLEPVDLLGGGAIGIGGGRVRHQLDATAAITRGGIGARAGLSWRGRSELETRVDGRPDLLEFSPLLVLNLRAFADAKRLFPSWGWASGTRLSLNLLNLTNDRQDVRDPFGNTPLQYQPGYRDPIGRTIEFELRKIF